MWRQRWWVLINDLGRISVPVEKSKNLLLLESFAVRVSQFDTYQNKAANNAEMLSRVNAGFHHDADSLDRLKDVQVVAGKKRKDVSTVLPTAVLAWPVVSRRKYEPTYTSTR